MFESDNLSHNGFTTIEILIVLMIMVLIFSFGFANYREFQRRKELEYIKNSVVTDLLEAREKAFSGVKPVGCVVLKSYNFNIINMTTYSIESECTNSNFNDKTVSLSSGYTIEVLNSMPNPLKFRSLGEGTNVPVCATPPCPSISLEGAITGERADVFVTNTGVFQ